MLFPELEFPEVVEYSISFRLGLLAYTSAWLGLMGNDIYKASVCYDAADSLLGDGFPTLMRGAKAQATSAELLKELRKMSTLIEAQCRVAGVQIQRKEGE